MNLFRVFIGEGYYGFGLIFSLCKIPDLSFAIVDSHEVKMTCNPVATLIPYRAKCERAGYKKGQRSHGTSVVKDDL